MRPEFDFLWKKYDKTSYPLRPISWGAGVCGSAMGLSLNGNNASMGSRCKKLAANWNTISF